MLIPSYLSQYKWMEAIHNMINARMDEIRDFTKYLTLYDINDVPAEMLPFLAWQFGTPLFDQSSEYARRELVKSGLQRKKQCGTVYAIQTALKTAGFNNIEIIESRTKPFRFSVSAVPPPHLSAEEAHRQINILINSHKNVRSILIGSTIKIDLSSDIHIQGALWVSRRFEC